MIKFEESSFLDNNILGWISYKSSTRFDYDWSFNFIRSQTFQSNLLFILPDKDLPSLSYVHSILAYSISHTDGLVTLKSVEILNCRYNINLPTIE